MWAVGWHNGDLKIHEKIRPSLRGAHDCFGRHEVGSETGNDVTKVKPQLGAVDLVFAGLPENGFGNKSIQGQRIMNRSDEVCAGCRDCPNMKALAVTKIRLQSFDGVNSQAASSSLSFSAV